MSSALAWYGDYFQQIQATLPHAGLSWLGKYRQEQFAQFLLQGFPTRRQESWRYTDLSPLISQNFSLANKHSSPTIKNSVADYELKNTEYLRLVFANGYYQANLSQLSALPADVILLPLSEALAVCPQQIMPYLQQDFSQQPFANLNAAFMTDGLFLYVPPHRVIEQPIQLLFLSTAEQPIMQQTRNIAIIGEQAQVTLFEQHVSLTTAPHWNNVITQIDVAPGANVQYCKCQQESATTIHSAQVHIRQQHDSQVNAWQGAFGAQLAREDWQIHLAEKNAALTLHGWYGAMDKQHLAQQAHVHHDAPATTSRIFYKGLASDQATAVFNGKITVQKTAPATRANLTNPNLLLDKAATINTKPELEIYTDDVQCTHGATVGQLDEEALFYLRARGLNKTAAQQLLLQAFAENMLEFIPTNAIRTSIQSLMQQKLLCLAKRG